MAHDRLERGMLVVPTEDMLWYIDSALDAMVGIVGELGDEWANARPPLPGANPPYVILNHCLGVMEFWGGGVIAGRPFTRDRAAEFESSGPVGDLIDRALDARERLKADVAHMDSTAPPHEPPGSGLHSRGASAEDDAGIPLATSQGGVLLHIYEELSQHLGQMEITRDLLLVGQG